MTNCAEQTSNAYGVFTGDTEVRFERLLPGPIERLWTYLTDPQKRATWLAAGAMELRVGGKVELHFPNADLSPHPAEAPAKHKGHENSGTVRSRVLRCDPPTLLSYTWGTGPQASEVTFELTPRGSDVLLTLTHRRIVDRNEAIDVSGGWHTHLDILADVLAGRVPQAFWATYPPLETHYTQMLS